MNLLRLPRVAALLVLTASGLIACISSDSSGRTRRGAGGEGGAILWIETDTTVGPSGPAGPAGPSAGSGYSLPDPHCMGDAGVLEHLTAGPIACTSGEECCVIVDPCFSRSRIVAATNAKEAHDAWPYCALDCNDCNARAIEVACVSGSCLGRVVEGVSSSSPLRKNHCGTGLEFVQPNGGPTATQFSCDLGPGP